MARCYLWEFKNRREQHKYLVRLERNAKLCLRQTHNLTKHSKKRLRNIAWCYIRERALEQQSNKWIM